MTLEEFVKKYIGKKVDYDGVFGSQCVDLFRQYVKDVLKIAEHTGSCSTSGGAKDLFLDYHRMPVEKNTSCVVLPKRARRVMFLSGMKH